MAQRIRIRIEGYDHEIIDQSAMDIVNTAKRTARRSRSDPADNRWITVLRSPHVDKNRGAVRNPHPKRGGHH
jgi:small subunit ribosomal protein S10